MYRITRRDFVNGCLLASGGLLAPVQVFGAGEKGSAYYPPTRMGLRGSHPGSNDYAHSRAWNRKSNWGPTSRLRESFDLVVVGGGLSGLAAAYFYRKKHGPETKILVLDNHDDFGGHAKRIEHHIDGRMRIGYGGSQTIVEPAHADKIILDLLEDIGVDLNRFETAYDRQFFARHGLGGVTYFNKKTFGQDRVVRHAFCNYPNYVEGLLGPQVSNEEAVAQTPLSETGKSQLLSLLDGGLHKIDVPEQELDEYISKRPYFGYLKDTLGIDDPQVLAMARNSGLDWSSSGTDLLTIAQARACGAMGFAPVAVYDEDNPYIHHFPDGNAGVARALVKHLVPKVAPGQNAEDLVLARFNYDELDRPGNQVRIRLNSTAVNVAHAGDPDSSSDVLINYVNDNKHYQVKAKGVVMACYNMMVPHIVAGLPEKQAAALALQDKSPLQYTTVGLRNWRAFKALGIGLAMSPGNMHQAVLMDFPVSLGGYEFTSSPEQPCVIQMISCPYGKVGAPRGEQFREARYKMLSRKFEDYEAEIRDHLNGMLPESLFDFDRDVASIAVNRWAHGYAVSGPGDSTRIGRQPFGRITIANADSAGEADAKTAMAMGYRAVNELG